MNVIVVDDSRTGFLVFIDYGTTKEREYIYEWIYDEIKHIDRASESIWLKHPSKAQDFLKANGPKSNWEFILLTNGKMPQNQANNGRCTKGLKDNRQESIIVSGEVCDVSDFTTH